MKTWVAKMNRGIFFIIVFGICITIASFANGQEDPWLPKGMGKIKPGFSKGMVRSTVGEPDCIIHNTDPSKNIFGQGSSESKIKEGWIYYSKKQAGYGMEIYFDSKGLVLRKNGGYGLVECPQ